MSISLCMIVKDEGQFLEGCLESMKDFVDEIIVVDTGSTDKTVEIANKFGAKVVKHEWNNSFSEARNVSLKHATKDWILVLDADERISENDLAKIKELTENNDIAGYRFLQRNYKNESHWSDFVVCNEPEAKGFVGYVPSKLIRLFKNDDKIRFENLVHEGVDKSITDNGSRIAAADVQIHHYNALKGRSFHNKKREFYHELGEEQIKQNPNDARAYYETALIDSANKNHEEAVEKFKKVIELNPSYKEVYYNIAAEYFELDKVEEAEEMLRKSIETKPDFSSAYNLLGIILLHTKRAKEAVEVLKKGLEVNPRNYLLYETLGGIMLKAGKVDIAAKILRDGVRINPRHEGLLINLAGAYLQAGKFDDTISLLREIITVNPKSADAFANLVSVHVQMGRFEKAIETAKKAIKAIPEQKEVFEEQLKALESKNDIK